MSRLSKPIYGMILVSYVALFALAALVEWAWPKGKSSDCRDQWKDTIG